MHRAFFSVLIQCLLIGGLWAADEPTVKCPSPDGRFALRIAAPAEGSNECSADLIEKETGNAVLDLLTVFDSHIKDAVLVWSGDSKWVAYATRDNRQGETSVYFWNGTKFEEVPLPENLPDPKINFGKTAEGGGVKNYGGGTKPLRWLKSGDLELATDVTMLSRGDDRTYTGTVKFTVSFDAQHHATLHSVGKTTTKVD
jgi:hypothetical protein